MTKVVISNWYCPKCKKLVAMVALCRELDTELDGVLIPSSAAAILNSIGNKHG